MTTTSRRCSGKASRASSRSSTSVTGGRLSDGQDIREITQASLRAAICIPAGDAAVVGTNGAGLALSPEASLQRARTPRRASPRTHAKSKSKILTRKSSLSGQRQWIRSGRIAAPCCAGTADHCP
ncbi:hypothetical protein C5748_13925 [Phyllobacterium phragmitis]|uniref:Uncharacterized protein n=1 Tax=Phyllobacterium phragmitis TaxID=2670329 RepID=A0A2S9IQS3_9HYPH|nr:hypothetical protein C5748_13925 [Phyllobacterium phragmitis]